MLVLKRGDAEALKPSATKKIAQLQKIRTRALEETIRTSDPRAVAIKSTFVDTQHPAREPLRLDVNMGGPIAREAINNRVFVLSTRGGYDIPQGLGVSLWYT